MKANEGYTFVRLWDTPLYIYEPNLIWSAQKVKIITTPNIHCLFVTNEFPTYLYPARKILVKPGKKIVNSPQQVISMTISKVVSY